MVIKTMHDEFKANNFNHEKLKRFIEKLNGVDVFISVNGDRVSIVKFKQLQCYFYNIGNEHLISFVEANKREEDCGEVCISAERVLEVKVLEWDEKEKNYYIVFKFKTGNELYINSCVA